MSLYSNCPCWQSYVGWCWALCSGAFLGGLIYRESGLRPTHHFLIGAGELMGFTAKK